MFRTLDIMRTAFYDRRIGLTHFAVDKKSPSSGWKVVNAQRSAADVVEDLDEVDDVNHEDGKDDRDDDYVDPFDEESEESDEDTEEESEDS